MAETFKDAWISYDIQRISKSVTLMQRYQMMQAFYAGGFAILELAQAFQREHEGGGSKDTFAEQMDDVFMEIVNVVNLARKD